MMKKKQAKSSQQAKKKNQILNYLRFVGLKAPEQFFIKFRCSPLDFFI